MIPIITQGTAQGRIRIPLPNPRPMNFWFSKREKRRPKMVEKVIIIKANLMVTESVLINDLDLKSTT